MTRHVESQTMNQPELRFNYMEVIISLLIADMRKVEIILFQHLHGRTKDRGEEACSGFYTTSVNVVQTITEYSHLLKVENLCVYIGETSISREDEQVTHESVK